MLPLHLGDESHFRILREFLSAAGYTEPALLQRFNLPQMDWLFESEGLAADYLAEQYRDQSLLVYLARTLIGGYPTTSVEAARFLPPHVLDALLALGLLEPHPSGHLLSPVTLYPSMGFLLVSDRAHGPLGPAYLEQDFVMNMALNFSQRYVEAIGTQPCGQALEIGAGAGLGALVLSRCATTVWATDITGRSLHFAAFNAQLNGLANVQFAKGDLFQPVEGMQFDRIASHPPFEPAVKGGNYIYSVGGEDGEELLARLVSECPRHLTPGGRAYINIAGTDRRREPLQARVRRWLGEASREFDVALFVRLRRQPMDYARDLVFSENKDPASLPAWEELYQRLDAELVIVGYLVLQRRSTEREVFSIRRDFGPNTTPAEMEWLLDWEARRVQPGFYEFMRASRPSCTSGWDLNIRHAMVDGRLAPVIYEFSTTAPFEERLTGESWMESLLSRCDGESTGSELFAFTQASEPIPQDRFLQAIAGLVSGGILRLK